ncbi:MAG TPA: hypothetical protein VE988_12560 [Gemmataceae bacterium]|nr:hypothetical protein [Gemmataceae bacterium]
MRWLLVGYCISVAIETPVLMVGLSRDHPLMRRFLSGLWLTACTYPVFILALPELIPERNLYLAVGETLVAVAECSVFLAAFGLKDRNWLAVSQDCLAIVLANLASFGLGEWMHMHGWFEGLAG